MKKYLLSILFVMAVLVLPASAVSLFPVDSTQADGFTSWGYMDEDGAFVIPLQYASASAFTEDGLAVVTDRGGNTAVIDIQGKQVVPFRAAPEKTEFDDKTIAFRYEGETVFFDKTGRALGSFAGASGFFSAEGLLPVRQDGLWGYVSPDGEAVLTPQYREAGAFSCGVAVVRLANDSYAVIDAAGEQTPLPTGAVPKYMQVYDGDVVIVTDRSRAALYSLGQNKLLTDYMYQEISPYADGQAAARLNNLWGILNLRGETTVPFGYNYLSYMGEGVYAARGEGGVSAIDANGNLIYRTYVYAGGFQTLTHGLSWHGTMDNSLIFFSKVGGYVTRLANAEKPTILNGNVALVTIGGKRQYVRLRDGKTLYSPQREYDMGYVKITTKDYEKYLGMRADGTEYGWSLSYPVVSGLADKAVQAKLNTAIETFFVEGPSFSAQRQPLTGSYGLRVKGRLLIVWADCVSGAGEGAVIWNDSIALDLATGARYQVVRDLFTRDYLDTFAGLLPADIPYYLFSYPRITDTGVSLYLNQAQSSKAGPSTKEYAFTFTQLDAVLNKKAECFRALSGTAIGAINQYTGYRDVPKGHWAYAAIRTVTEAELMQGSGGKFQPEKTITTAEVCAVLVRALTLDVSKITPPAGAPWYYIETTAAEQAGLTQGLTTPLDYTAAMRRADAMQVLAGVLERSGAKPLADAEVTQSLARFTDAADVPENRRAAVALCVKSGIIAGTDGRLDTAGVFTRAQFAQILSNLPATADKQEE